MATRGRTRPHERGQEGIPFRGGEHQRRAGRVTPADSAPLYHSGTSLCRLDADGWPGDYDDLDRAEAVTVEPISVQDTELA